MKNLFKLGFLSLLLAVFVVSCKETETIPEVLKLYSLTEKVGNYGYVELLEANTKWIFSIPLDKKSPLNDPDGAFHAASLQPLPDVMILMGTQEGKSNRTITIPSGKYVYLPLVFSSYWHYANDKCDPTFQPAAGQTLEAFLLGLTKDAMDDSKKMTAKLDGVEIVPDLTKYRVKTKAFTMLIANDFNTPACDYSKQNATVASEGFALLMKIPKGKHTLTYNTQFDSDPVPHQADTWNLIVE